MKLGSGWLSSRPDLPELNMGIPVPRWSEREQAPFPTRREEYWFVREELARLNPMLHHSRRLLCVDSGSGFNDEIHVMPTIVKCMGFDVIAIDTNPASLVMRHVDGVTRFCGDIRHLPNLDATADAWICVSTLEHMNVPDQQMTLKEGLRVLKPGGIALVTADEFSPEDLTRCFQLSGFETGSTTPAAEEHVDLEPRVGWIVARKP